MSFALRIARVARPLVANTQVARFSVASRAMAAGDDAFSKREEAAENLYVKKQEREKLEALRKKIKDSESQLAKDKADLDKAEKK
jgi:hypothetical protein